MGLNGIIFASERFIAYALHVWMPEFFLRFIKIPQATYVSIESLFVAICYFSAIWAGTINFKSYRKMLFIISFIYLCGCIAISTALYKWVVLGLLLISLSSGYIKITTMGLFDSAHNSKRNICLMYTFVNLFATISALVSPVIIHKLNVRYSAFSYTLIMSISILVFFYYNKNYIRINDAYSKPTKRIYTILIQMIKSKTAKKSSYLHKIILFSLNDKKNIV